MKPTYEELELRLLETESKLAETQRLLKLALERIAILEERLNKNSNNSSKPPSTDQKANSRGQKALRRKNRGQGINREAFPPEQVDNFVKCSLEACPHCGSKELSELNDSLSLQQVDIPKVSAIVTQFNCTKHKCRSCGTHAFAQLPLGVPNSAFGPHLMTLIATFTGVLHISKRDAIQLVQDLYGVKVCEGSIINIEERVASAISESYERIHSHVMKSVFSKHFDETSWRDRGVTHYVWVASTSNASCFCIDPNRSKAAFQRFAENLSKAPIITDRYGAYTHIDQPHQFCLAHLIRDFRKYAQRDGPDREIGALLTKELQQVCKNHRSYRNGEISKRSRNSRFCHQKKRLDNLLMDGFANGSDELSGLCDRLLSDYAKIWAFSDFEDVEPTNNLAERDLRRVVLWRKKSYGTRSARGQRFVERISSVSQTLKRSGINIFEYLKSSVEAFYRGNPAPMINPNLGF